MRASAKGGYVAAQRVMSVIWVPLIQQASTASAGLWAMTFAASGAGLWSASMPASQLSMSSKDFMAMSGGARMDGDGGNVQMIWLAWVPLSRSSLARIW